MSREAREKLVLDLLQTYWDDTNTFGLTPKISFGWFDSDQETPQVTIAQPSEGPINGGNTGYSGFNGQTGAPVQTISGTIDVHLWCGFDELDNATTDNPRQYLTEVNEEAYRIIRNHADNPENPVSGNRPVWAIAPGNDNPVPEPDERGVFHHLSPIEFIYDSER